MEYLVLIAGTAVVLLLWLADRVITPEGVKFYIPGYYLEVTVKKVPEKWDGKTAERIVGHLLSIEGM